jgi:hypothetical protein
MFTSLDIDSFDALLFEFPTAALHESFSRMRAQKRTFFRCGQNIGRESGDGEKK